MAELNDLYPADTAELMQKYLSGIKDRHGQLARIRVFADFYNVTKKDLMRASLDTLSGYCSHLAEKVRKGEYKNSTAIKQRKIIAAFLSWCMNEKESGNDKVPDGFVNNMLSIKSDDIGEEYRYGSIPTLTDFDNLVGWLKENDKVTLCAVMLSAKCFLKTGEILRLKCNSFAIDNTEKMFIIPDKDDRRNNLIKVSDDITGLVTEIVANVRSKYPDMENPWLFPSKMSKGQKHCTEQWLSKKLKKACGEVGAKEITLNSVKNLGAINAVANKADVTELNDAMGYKTRAHIKRLTSLNLNFDSVGADYVNINLKKEKNEK